MQLRTFLLCTTLLLVGPKITRGTPVAATLSGENHWASTHSPYLVTGDVTLELLSTLTIAPGVVVEFETGASLVIKGELIARGTQADPIVFAGAASDQDMARWGSIIFDNDSVDASFTFLHDYQAGSILEWCVVEGASRGVVLKWAAPYIHHCTFRHNRTPFSVDIEGGAAIYMLPGSSPRVRDCRFEANVADGFGYGGALYIDDAQPILQDNVFVDNTAIYGGAVSTNLMASPVVGNHFQGNSATGSGYSKGGGLALVSSVPAVLNNTFTDNHSVLDGGGIHVCVDCFPHATPVFFDNTITGNSAQTDDPASGAGGLGAGYLRMVSDNNITDNTRNGEPSDFGWYHPLAEAMPDWVANPVISNNWWGTTQLEEIAARVTDSADIDGVGTVQLEPVLTAPVEGPSPRITLTTRRLHYDEPGEPMRVYLTVYNPGAEAAFEMRLLLVYDGGGAFPLLQPVGLPDETVRGGSHHFQLPENGVFFSELLSPTYAGTQGLSGGHFVAALYDHEGALLGRPSEIRFDLVGEVTP
jgi:hypothetical protein